MRDVVQRSAAYSINLGADGSIEPIANCPTEDPAAPRIPDQEFAVLRRVPRSSASSIANSAAGRGSGQVRLSMLSSASSQPGFGHPQRLAAISSVTDADVQETRPPQDTAGVDPRSDDPVSAAEQIKLERVELLDATGQ